MKNLKFVFCLATAILFSSLVIPAQTPTPTPPMPMRRPMALQFGTYKLADVRMRDVCILVDEKTKTYYAVSSGFAPSKEGFRNAGVRAFTSKDLINWEGPTTIFQTPTDIWGTTNIRSIWAPEMHAYKGKYYLFLTFDSDEKFPEQWRDWLPRQKKFANSGRRFAARTIQTIQK